MHFRQGIKNLPAICAQQGVKQVVIAPGSRNVPLIMAFTAHADLECLSITDERCAAYFALGIAQQSGQAVALICTSGTAVLNFAPALAEAYYQNIPLVVFTADRPTELIDQADGQTIRQEGIFHNYIKAEYSLPVETTNENELSDFNSIATKAIISASNYPCGPVHINVPLREPIYTALPENETAFEIEYSSDNAKINNAELTELAKRWSNFQRKLIIVGFHSPDAELNKMLNYLAESSDTVVLADNLANCYGEKFITAIDAFFTGMSEEELKEFQPDLVLTVGHSIISKQLKQYLKNYKPKEQWQVGCPMPYNTYGCLTLDFPVKPIELLAALDVNGGGEYAYFAARRKAKQALKHTEFIAQASFSDLKAVAQSMDALPDGSMLQIANSTSIRLSQLMPVRNDVTYFCNRGTSGIDGSTSTAIGAAFASNRPTVFLTGDLSFLYDSNALWNNYIKCNFKIILLNNNGGNIFRLIGGNTVPAKAQQFLTTPHSVNIKQLVEAFGVDYISCENEKELPSGLNSLFERKNCCVLEIITDAEISAEVYASYFK